MAEELGFVSLNILVDNELCWVVKVTVLGLPDAEVLRTFKGVSELKGHGAELAEVRVEDLKTTLDSVPHEGRISEWDIGRTSHLIVENCMSVRKGASFDILPNQSRVESLK